MVFEDDEQRLNNDSHLTVTALRTKVSKGKEDGVKKEERRNPDEPLGSSGEI